MFVEGAENILHWHCYKGRDFASTTYPVFSKTASTCLFNYISIIMIRFLILIKVGGNIHVLLCPFYIIFIGNF